MERPILFSAPMVQAILAGRKTMTRRVINKLKGYPGITEFGQSDTNGYDWHFRDKQKRWHDIRHDRLLELCPYGKVGDRLWVKETTIHADEHGYVEPIYVASDDGQAVLDTGLRPAPDDYADVEPHDIKLRPSIFMPKKFARIWLEITDIRVERLQDISEEDIHKEGIVEGCCLRCRFEACRCEDRQPDLRQGFAKEWSSINGFFPDGGKAWRDNPWVWVISFKVVRGGDL